MTEVVNPYRAVQALLRLDNGKPVGVLGSCFRIHSPRHFLTAAHCVANLLPDDIAVWNIREGHSDFPCLQVYRHPQADLAVIEVQDSLPQEYQQLHLTDWGRSYGAPVYCFGMVTDSLPGFRSITQRVIGGIIQRDYVHRERPYEFQALEFSAPIPSGMSGGPAYYMVQPRNVIGLAVGTIQSELMVSRLEEIQNGNEVFRERISEITRYGVLLWLERVKDWIFETMGPPN